MEKHNNPFFSQLQKLAGIHDEEYPEDVIAEDDEVTPEEQVPVQPESMEGQEVEEVPVEEQLPPEVVEGNVQPEMAVDPAELEQAAPVDEGEVVPEELQGGDMGQVDPALAGGGEELIEPPPETPEQIEAAIDGAAAEASDEAEQAIAEAKAVPGHVAPNISTQLEGPVTVSQMEEMEQVAEAFPEYAAIAKVASLAFIEDVDDTTRQSAIDMFKIAFESLEGFEGVTEKVASEMFDSPEAKRELYSVESMERVANVLQYITDSEEVGFSKQAEEGESFANKAKSAVDNFRSGLTDLVDKAKYNLVNIKGDIDQGRIQLAELDNEIAKASEGFSMDRMDTTGIGSEMMDLRAQRRQLEDGVGKLVRTRNMSLGGAVAGVGAAAAGAYAGGRALHNHFADNEVDDTLEAEQPNSLNGGVPKMSYEKDYVNSMLKLASVAGLQTLVANGQAEGATEEDFQLAKEASERFDQISMLNPAYIGPELVKLAHELFSEDQLKEVVAGEHTDEIFEKTAAVVSWGYADDAELEKIANAGSVAARGVGDALRNAKEEVENIIGQAKVKAESNQERYGEKGQAGFGNLSSLDGYSVINNPERYEVSKTASEAVEEAFMLKQAAAQANMEADALLNKFAQEGYIRER